MRKLADYESLRDQAFLAVGNSSQYPDSFMLNERIMQSK